MKVLMIRYANGISGAETYNENLIKGLQKQSSDVTVLYVTNDRTFAGRLKSLQVRVFLFNPLVKEIGTKKEFLLAFFLSPIIVFRYLKLISFINRRNSIDVICLQSTTEKLFLTYFLNKLRYRVIWLEHGAFYYTNRAYIIKKLHSLLSRYVDTVIAVSKDTKRDIADNIFSKKVIYLPSGIDTNFFKPAKKTSHDNFVVGYCGKLVKEKGIMTFMHVAARVLNKTKNVSFLIVGDGAYYDWVEGESKKLLGKDKVILTGFKTDVKKYLAQMDIFFFPTYHTEGMSIALLEAAAMEVLVIAHDSGGNREIVIPGKTGVLYTQATEEQLAQLLLSSINQYATFKHLRSNARKLVIKNYTIDKMAKQFSLLCKKL